MTTIEITDVIEGAEGPIKVHLTRDQIVIENDHGSVVLTLGDFRKIEDAINRATNAIEAYDAEQ